MDESIRNWIPGLRDKQPHIVEAFFRYAHPRMLRFARRLLRGVPQAESDEEDVVNAALHSFLWRTADDQFQLADEDDLWKVIQTIVSRKASNHRRRQRRRIDTAGYDGVPEAVCRHATSLLQQEAQKWWIAQLDGVELQQIAKLKCENRTNVEIAAVMQRSVATVERRLKMIRSQWNALDDAEIRHWVAGEKQRPPED